MSQKLSAPYLRSRLFQALPLGTNKTSYSAPLQSSTWPFCLPNPFPVFCRELVLPTRAAIPALTWTTVPPAKSSAPSFARNPPPYPTGYRRVYKRHPENGEEDTRRKLHPFDVGTAGKGNSDRSERQLIGDVDDLGYRLCEVGKAVAKLSKIIIYFYFMMC